MEKNLKLCLCFFWMLAAWPLFAQTTPPDVYVLPTRVGTQWGGVTSEGRQIAPPQFDFAQALTQQLLGIKRDQKYGIYHLDGRQVLPTEADQLLPLDSQYVAYRKGETWGIITSNGNKTNTDFDTLLRLGKDAFAVKKAGKVGFWWNGALRITPQLDSLSLDAPFVIAYAEGNMSIFDRKGQLLTTADKYFVGPQEQLFFTQNNQWGCLAADGKTLLPNAYVRVALLGDDLVALRGLSGKWVAWDARQQRLLTEEAYDYFKASQTHLIAQKELTFSILDRKGKVLAENFSNVHLLSEGHPTAQKAGEGWALLSPQGKALTPYQYSVIYDLPPNETFTKVRQGNHEGLLGMDGKLLLPLHYEAIEVYADQILAFLGEAVSVFDKSTFKKIAQYDHFAELDQTPNPQDRIIFTWGAKPPPSLHRWHQKNTTQKWMLIYPNGKKVFPQEFDLVQTDPYTQLTRAKRLDEQGRVTHCALVDHITGKLLFLIKAADVEMEDFRVAGLARVILDTLKHDALVTRSGRLLEGFDTLGTFSEGLLWARQAGKYGCFDTAGNIQIPFVFEDIQSFKNGRAAAKQAGKYGFINTQGDWMVAPAYDAVSEFRNGFAPVIQGKKYGLVSQTGQLVIPTAYDRMSFARQAIVRAQKAGKWGVLDTQGKVIIPFENAYIGTFIDGIAKIRSGGQYGWVRSDGSYLLRPSITCNDIGQPYQGIAWIKLEPYKDESNPTQKFYFKKHGYIRTSGEVLIPPIYSVIEGFETAWTNKRGFARVEKDDKIGYLDHTGKVVVPPIYDEIAAHFGQPDTVCRVRQGDKVGYLDAMGKVVFPLVYQEVIGFEQIWNKPDRLCAVRLDGRWGAVDRLNNVVLRPEYDFVGISPQNDTLALVRQGKDWGVVNQFNQSKLPTDYQKVKYLHQNGQALLEVWREDPLSVYFSIPKGQWLGSALADQIGDYGQGYIAARQGDRWGFQDGRGTWTIAPEWAAVGGFSGGLAPVWREGKWGVIDTMGKIIISFDYEVIKNFVKNLAPAKKDGKWGLLDGQANWILPPRYAEISSIGSEGYWSIRDERGQCALADAKGELQTKFIYLELANVVEGMIAAKIADKKVENQKFGFINTQGQTVIPHLYASVQDFSEGLVWVKLSQNGKWSLLNQKGQTLIQTRYVEALPFREGLAVVEGRQLINAKGTRVASLPATALGTLSEGTLAVLGKDGYYHVRRDGSPLYAGRFDSVTAFVGGLAWAKLGQQWGLRRLNLGTEGEVVLPFSTPAKLRYQSQFPKNRLQTTRYGERFKDLGWEQLRKGHWRLISADGAYFSPSRFADIQYVSDDLLRLTASPLIGIADLNGRWVAPPVYTSRAYLPGGILRLENTEGTAYVHISGRKIFFPESLKK